MALFEKGIKKVVLPAAAAAGVALTPEESEAGIIKSFIDIARSGAKQADRAKLFVDAHKTISPTGLTRNEYGEKIVEQLLKENPDIEKSIKKGDGQEAFSRMLEKIQQDPSQYELIDRKDFLKQSFQDEALRKNMINRLSDNGIKNQSDEVIDQLVAEEKQSLIDGSRGFFNPVNNKITVFNPQPNKPLSELLGTVGHETLHIPDTSKTKTLYTNVIDKDLEIPGHPFSKEERNLLYKRSLDVPGGVSPGESRELISKHYDILPHILHKKDPEKAQALFKSVQAIVEKDRAAATKAFKNGRLSIEEFKKINKPEYFDKKIAESAFVYFPDMGPDELRSIGHTVTYPEGVEKTILRNSVVNKTPILDPSNFSFPSEYKKSAAAVTGVLGANALGSEAQASTIGEPGNFSPIPKEMQETEEPKKTGFVWKALDAISYPQRAAFNTAASMLGTKGDIENSEKSAQAIVENLAERAGIPEDSTVGNAAKALGVAGLEVMTDPTDLLGIGTFNKGAKAGRKAWKALKKVNK